MGEIARAAKVSNGLIYRHLAFGRRAETDHSVALPDLPVSIPQNLDVWGIRSGRMGTRLHGDLLFTRGALL